MIINTIIIILSIAFAVYLLRKGVNSGYIMLFGSAIVIFAAGIKPYDGLIYAFHGLVSYKTIELIIILFLIMMIENIMRTSGMIKTMVENLKMLVGSKRLAAALMPTVMGLLPSPGGARFSCPMVEEALSDSAGDEEKAFINYWFRHIWLDGFILYPGVILASSLLDVSVLTFFLYVLPFILLTGIIGAIFAFILNRKHFKNSNKIQITKTSKKSYAINFTKSVFPVVALISIYIILLPITALSLEISALAVIIGLLIYKKYDFKKIVKTAKEAFPIKLVIIILGVMVFKQVLSESGLIVQMSNFFAAYGIPSKALYLILPFLGAISSGITVSYVSITFPILIHLGMADNLWFAALAFTAGSIGGMVTPLHLCAVMTADYFKVSLGKLLTRIAKAELVVAAVICFIMVLI